ncbi:uncharacterized protein LOC127600023 isoform X1 [Hippocampus zosterae]|uniref:uncharacterized protein LOC127600023 isoform X1 n=1 Tax=Hippocampus zosterae TaxID=109293 RepID=UPI00223D53B0|nr:uncharacterized protein LOC127600023 isoform X1 [Hippocampus zosterae]
MHGCLLVLMLLACSCQAFNYMGTAFTYHALKGSDTRTVVRYKVAFQECGNVTVVDCPLDNCTIDVVSVKRVDENSGVWCQDEVTVHVDIPDNFTLNLDGLKWINVTNNVTDVLAVTRADVRIRSDTGRPNMSPRATMIPLYRVPSNCYFQSRMPIFDPDGDYVDCYLVKSDSNSDIPIIVHGCFLKFLPDYNKNNNISLEGMYAVQVVMEDSPLQDLTLTDAAGNEKFIYKYEPISEVPVQFVLKVDPPVESCQEGKYLPLFLDPTPNDGDHQYAFVNQTLEINIYASAEESTITQLLFSGPAGVTKESLGDGRFVLAWTPTPEDSGLRQAICFVVEATKNDTIFQSQMRCVIVAVDHLLMVLDAKFLSRSFHTLLDIKEIALPRLKKELVDRGLPPDITLRVVDFKEFDDKLIP